MGTARVVVPRLHQDPGGCSNAALTGGAAQRVLEGALGKHGGQKTGLLEGGAERCDDCRSGSRHDGGGLRRGCGVVLASMMGWLLDERPRPGGHGTPAEDEGPITRALMRAGRTPAFARTPDKKRCARALDSSSSSWDLNTAFGRLRESEARWSVAASGVMSGMSVLQECPQRDNPSLIAHCNPYQ